MCVCVCACVCVCVCVCGCVGVWRASPVLVVDLGVAVAKSIIKKGLFLHISYSSLHILGTLRAYFKPWSEITKNERILS